MAKFYTSDLHLGHQNIIKHEERPFDNVDQMEAVIIENWNNTVTDKDEVYILGDFSFQEPTEVNRVLRALNGKKYLIRGNHDYYVDKPAFGRTLFGWVKDCAMVKDEGRKVMLFHYPIAVWNCQHHGSYHCFGHIHRHDHHGSMPELTRNMFNVCQDANGFTPKTLDQYISEQSKG